MHSKGLNKPCKETLDDGKFCGLKYNKLIYGTNISGVNAVLANNVKAPDRGCLITTSDYHNHDCVLLPIQQMTVKIDRGLGTDIPMIFWDLGSNVNMVTKQFEKGS